MLDKCREKPLHVQTSGQINQIFLTAKEVAAKEVEPSGPPPLAKQAVPCIDNLKLSYIADTLPFFAAFSCYPTELPHNRVLF